MATSNMVVHTDTIEAVICWAMAVVAAVVVLSPLLLLPRRAAATLIAAVVDVGVGRSVPPAAVVWVVTIPVYFYLQPCSRFQDGTGRRTE